MFNRKILRKMPHELRWRFRSRAAISRRLQRQLELPDSRWLFLLGVNNSGTTVMSRLIAAHSAISDMAPEGQHVTTAFPLAWKLGVSRLWTERLDVFRWTEHDDAAPALRAKYDWSYYLSPNRYLFEKSPPDTIRSRWLQKNFNSAYFLAAVRHPYAVCEGIRRREGCTIERAAKHWTTANKLMLEDAEELTHFLIVRYEDFCSTPCEQLERVRGFLDLSAPYPPEVLQREFNIHNANNETTAVKNFNQGSFMRLSCDDVDQINQIAGAIMQKFAYELHDPCQFASEPAGAAS